MKKSSDDRFGNFADTGTSLCPGRDAESKQEMQRVAEATAAHALFKSRMESESNDDFVTLDGPMTLEEVHERLNAFTLQLS